MPVVVDDGGNLVVRELENVVGDKLRVEVDWRLRDAIWMKFEWTRWHVIAAMTELIWMKLIATFIAQQSNLSTFHFKSPWRLESLCSRSIAQFDLITNLN